MKLGYCNVELALIDCKRSVEQVKSLQCHFSCDNCVYFARWTRILWLWSTYKISKTISKIKFSKQNLWR